MFNNKALSFGNLENINYKKTKKKVHNYFKKLEKLEWEWNKLNTNKGLTANYDFAVEYRKQPYIHIGKDEFNMSAKEIKEEQLKKYIFSYYWAVSALSDMERLYIKEYFINYKFDDEITHLLNFDSIKNNEFIKLKRSAIYKFADFLNLLVEKC